MNDGRTIAQTPAPKSDRIKGSNKNKVGSAASKKSAASIVLSDEVIKALKAKADKYNETHTSKVSLNTLKAVFRRGSGAYSTSHRPTITGGVPNSRNAWSYARVNKFLLKKGGTKVKAAYVQDDDLMAKGGFLNKIANSLKKKIKIKNLSNPIIKFDQFGIETNFGKIEWKDSDTQFRMWIYDDNKAEEKLKGGEYDYFYGPTYIEDDVSALWNEKEYLNKFKGSKHLVGYIEGKINRSFTKREVLGVVIGVMTIRPDKRRQGINSLMIKYIRDKYNIPQDKIEFYRPSKEGESFISSKKYEDGGNIQNTSNMKLAPNGKLSNLNAEQYALVRTLQFKAWFGDWENAPERSSKVVDENGEPLVVYHGSANKFNVFDKKRVGENYFESKQGGFFFTQKLNTAKNYARLHTNLENDGFVYYCFLNIRNPLVRNTNSEYYSPLDRYDISRHEYISELRSKENIDGIIIFGTKKDNLYVVFNSKQIKLANGTNTTFDTNNPDIRYKDGGKLFNDIMAKGGENKKWYRKYNGDDALQYNKDAKTKYGSGIYFSSQPNSRFDREKEIAVFVGYKNPKIYENTKTIPNTNFIKDWRKGYGEDEMNKFVDDLFEVYDAIIVKHSDTFGDELIIRDKSLIKMNKMANGGETFNDNILKDMKYEDGGIIKSKYPAIDAILEAAKPYQDKMAQRVIDNMIEKGDKLPVNLDDFIIMIKLGSILDLTKALANYINQTDKLVDVEILNRSGIIEIVARLDRDGVVETLSTELISAGGYNIQSYHYRYIVHTKRPRISNSTATKNIEEEIKRIKTKQSIKEKIENEKELIEKLNNQILIDTKTIEENKKVSDAQIWDSFDENGHNKTFSRDTYEDYLKRSEYDTMSREEYKQFQERNKQRAIDRWKDWNIRGKEVNIVRAKDDIKKALKKIDKLSSQTYEDGGYMEDGGTINDFKRVKEQYKKTGEESFESIEYNYKEASIVYNDIDKLWILSLRYEAKPQKVIGSYNTLKAAKEVGLYYLKFPDKLSSQTYEDGGYMEDGGKITSNLLKVGDKLKLRRLPIYFRKGDLGSQKESIKVIKKIRFVKEEDVDPLEYEGTKKIITIFADTNDVKSITFTFRDNDLISATTDNARYEPVYENGGYMEDGGEIILKDEDYQFNGKDRKFKVSEPIFFEYSSSGDKTEAILLKKVNDKQVQIKILKKYTPYKSLKISGREKASIETRIGYGLGREEFIKGGVGKEIEDGTIKIVNKDKILPIKDYFPINYVPYSVDFKKYISENYGKKNGLWIEKNNKMEDGGEMQDELVIESKYSVSDIDHKYPTIPHQYLNKQLMDGIEVEMEHTSNPEVARKIALDHLYESIYYYEELEKMEKRLEMREVDEHYDSIKNKYEDGGLFDEIFHFNTPTKERSRLTYIQQVLVRTSAFKNYFGDWERAANRWLADDKNNYDKHYKDVSKVIDTVTLEPRVLYHGTMTEKEFFSFDVTREKGVGRPYAYFAYNKQYAEHFSRANQRQENNPKPFLYEVFLNVRHPFLAQGHEYTDKSKDAESWLKAITGTIVWDRYKTVQRDDFAKAVESTIENQVGRYVKSVYSAIGKSKFWKLMAADIDKKFKYFLIAYDFDGIFYSEEISQNYDVDNPAQFTNAITVFDATQIKLADGRNTQFNPFNPDIRFEEGGKTKEIVEEVELAPKKLNKIEHLHEMMENGGKVKGNNKLYNDAKDGGYFMGKSHAKGGIKVKNVDTNQIMEVEGNEVIINKRSVADTTKREFEGKMLTNREILSKINEDGGGVSFKDGGEMDSCGCSGKKYKFGGETLEDYMIIHKMNGLYEDSSAANRKYIDELISKMQ